MGAALQRAIRAVLLVLALLPALPPPARAQPSEDLACGPDDDVAARQLLRRTLHQVPIRRETQPLAAGGTASAPRPVPADQADQSAPPPGEPPPGAEGAKPPSQDRPPPAASFRAPPRQTAREEGVRLSGSSVRVRITLEGNDPESWSRVKLRAAARTRDHVARPAAARPGGAAAAEGGGDLCRYRFLGVNAVLRAQNERIGSIEVDYPRGAGGALRESWTLVVALHTLDEDKLFAYGTVDVEVGSLFWSAALSLALMVAVYALLMAVALRAHGRRLRLVEAARARAEAREARDPPPLGWRLRLALNPLFITQDASGIASLARFQLLVFTLAVTFVCAYVFLRTGELASLSEDVLKLLGIAVVGSALARIGGETGSVTPANRIWLKGKRLILADDARLPQVADLVTADGELQVARVQAIIFSSLTVAALVWTGPRDLGGFEISDEVLYLLGLSQIAYVAGRAIPAEAVRRLDQEVAALRAAERQREQAEAKLAVQQRLDAAAAETVRLEAEAQAARTAWNAALLAAEDSLRDVYGDALDIARLRALAA